MNNIISLERKFRLYARFSAAFCRFSAALLISLAASSFLIGQVCTDSFYVKFPDDFILTACSSPAPPNYSPQFFAADESYIAASFKDDTNWVVPDACFTVERTWKIINWCYYDTACTFQRIPNPSPNATAFHPDNRPGPVVSGRCDASATDPWSATQVKLTPTDTSPANFCTFWKGGVACSGTTKFNGYVYTQIIKVMDAQPPTVRCAAPNGNDLTTNDREYWNTPDWWDPAHNTPDLAEMPVDLSIIATDACTGANLNIRYLLFLDLDANGTQETVINSEQPQQPNTVFFDNAQFPNFIGGSPRAFDQRPLANPVLDAYRFAIELQSPGKCDFRTNDTAAVRFNTQRNPGKYVLPQLPHGKHKIKWIITDACGNQTACEQAFEVKDAKKPTLVCKKLSVNIIQTGMVQLWATGFLEAASDNITPDDQLLLAVSTAYSGPTIFPTDSVGRPITNLFFNCANLGPNVVQLWAKDKAGNADYCEVALLVQDGLKQCGIKLPIYGNAKTITGKGIKGVSILVGLSNSTTDSLGRFNISNALPISAKTDLCPLLDEAPLNGVNALDMALINKHILDIKPLNSPQNIISADANKSGTITTLDIVTIRSLILGKIPEFPNANSWWFYDKKFVFTNPFASPFPACVMIKVPQTDSLEFIGTKTGDVDNSARPNVNINPITRTAYLDTEDRTLQAGDEFPVAFTTSEALAAQQFTLDHPGLDLLSIVPGNTPELRPQNFAAYDSIRTLTAAWNVGSTDGERPAFTLRFRAKVSGTLSQFLKLSNRITETAAFGPLNTATMRAEWLHLALRFKTVSSPEPGAEPERFTLYQNQPNPFSQSTAIGFYLPNPDRAILTVTDASGRVCHRQEGQFAKGYQQFVVDEISALPSGVLYYQVATSNGVESKKMVMTGK